MARAQLLVSHADLGKSESRERSVFLRNQTLDPQGVEYK